MSDLADVRVTMRVWVPGTYEAYGSIEIATDGHTVTIKDCNETLCQTDGRLATLVMEDDSELAQMIRFIASERLEERISQ